MLHACKRGSRPETINHRPARPVLPSARLRDETVLRDATSDKTCYINRGGFLTTHPGQLDGGPERLNEFQWHSERLQGTLPDTTTASMIVSRS